MFPIKGEREMEGREREEVGGGGASAAWGLGLGGNQVNFQGSLEAPNTQGIGPWEDRPPGAKGSGRAGRVDEEPGRHCLRVEEKE